MNSSKKILKEIHHQNKNEFQFSHYAFNSLYNPPEIPNHIHEEMELIYFKKGKVYYEIDFLKYEVKGESILIINKNLVHGIERNKENFGEGEVYIFNSNMLEGALGDFYSSKYINPIINDEIHMPLIISFDDNPQAFIYLRNTLLEISKLYKNQKNAYELKIKIKVMDFFAHLYEEEIIFKKNPNEKEEKKKAKLEKVFYYIHENYEKNISIEDVAKLLCLSPSYCGKLFKKYTGISFIDYLNNYRLNQGAQLLFNTELPITDIAYKVGFENLSYFINSFKRLFNETPRNYRKNNNSNSNYSENFI